MKKLTFLAIALCGVVAKGSAQTDSLALHEVVVTGSRQATDVRYLPMNVTVIGRDQLTENHQSSILPTLTQEVPGLYVSSRGVMGYGVSGGGSGAFNLRGLSGGSRVLVLIDGHPQYANIFDHPIGDAYQTMMADRVEVVSGPAAVLYGSNAMGGVVNIVTRKMTDDGVHTNVSASAGSYGSVQAEVSNQVRQGRFNSTVAAQYRRSDNHRPNMGFEQYGGYLNLGYDLSDNWQARLSADVTHFNASHPGQVTSPLEEADQYITRGTVNATVSSHFDGLDGAISVYTNFGRHKINDGYGPQSNNNQPRPNLFRSKDALTGVSFYETMQLFEGNHLTVGADYQHIYGYAYNTSRADGSVVPLNFKAGTGKSYRNEWAGYVDFRQDLTSWLTVDAGLRYDWQNISGGEWVPQFGVVARPADNSQLKLTAGKGFRNPSMMELYFYGTNGNIDLEAERMWNYELSWRQRIGNFSYGANIFYLKADNLVGTGIKPDGQPGRINTGAFENAGYELQASYRVNRHFTVHANRSFLHQEEGKEQIGAPRYVDYLGMKWNAGRWTVNAGTQYVSDLYTGSATEPLQSFCLVNVTVDYRLMDGLQLWARGENLLRQKYEINAGYPMPLATFMAGFSLEL